MKQTIEQKAVAAINELNRVALLMARQMKGSAIDKTAGETAIISAKRKSKTFRNAYFNRRGGNTHLRELIQVDFDGLDKEFTVANERFNRVLSHYAKAVGVEV